MESMDINVNVEDEAPFVVFGNTDDKHKKTISTIWNFFTKIGKDEDEIEKAACNFCSTEFSIGKNPNSGHNYGTSHLSRHVSHCKSIMLNLFNHDEPPNMIRINQKTHRELLAEAIIAHDLPFSFVEYEKIQVWVNYMNPYAEMVCRNTIVSDIEKIYNKEKTKLNDIMGRIPNRICLTSDVWTTSTSEGYICLTAHFVDEHWKLNSCLLNFCRMTPLHNGIALEATLFDCLKQWGIDKKIFSITLNNASSNDNMQDHLKKHLCVQSNLLCDGHYFHVRCSAHILNLIVQEGLKVANEALKKIRESVKYVKGSDGRMIKFKNCVNNAGISLTSGLRLDVSTRSNNTYLMLESALKYRKAFEFYQVADRNYKHCPSDEEWERGESICELLEPFYEITKLISGSSYPTANLYFMQVWKVQCILEENQDKGDDAIREMATDMKNKFDKYWNDYSVVLAFAVILDPRLKVPFLKYCYTSLDALTCNVKIKDVEDKFRGLYQEYVNIFHHQNVVLFQSSQYSNSLSKSSREGSKAKKCKIISGFKTFQNQPIFNSGKCELDAYLEEKSIEFDEEHCEDFEVLLYWKINEKKYHVLSLMARDVLSISITTVASESSFSIGGRVLTKYRSSTLPDHIQMLIFTRNWLHGFS